MPRQRVFGIACLCLLIAVSACRAPESTPSAAAGSGVSLRFFDTASLRSDEIRLAICYPTSYHHSHNHSYQHSYYHSYHHSYQHSYHHRCTKPTHLRWTR